jgi:hypothetical protein
VDVVQQVPTATQSAKERIRLTLPMERSRRAAKSPNAPESTSLRSSAGIRIEYSAGIRIEYSAVELLAYF